MKIPQQWKIPVATGHILEWGGRHASPRDENFLREGGGRLRFLSSVPGRIENRGNGHPGRRRAKLTTCLTFGSPFGDVLDVLARWPFQSLGVTFLLLMKQK